MSKQSPLKKNVNEGAIHYLRLAPCHPLLLWVTAARRNRESIWWELGNPGGVKSLQSSFFSSAEDPAGSAFLAHRTAELFTSFLTKHWNSLASTFVQECLFTTQPRKAALLLYSLSRAKVLSPEPGFKGTEKPLVYTGEALASKFKTQLARSCIKRMAPSFWVSVYRP